MGFRSTMITEDMHIQIPQWFIEKYPNIHASYKQDSETNDNQHWFFPLSTVGEQKFYQSFKDYDLFVDIQKIIVDKWEKCTIELVLLHECGGITKVIINEKEILGMEPTAWKQVEGVEHNYCYGCSDWNKASPVEHSLKYNHGANPVLSKESLEPATEMSQGPWNDNFTMKDGTEFSWEKRKDMGMEKMTFVEFTNWY